MKWFNNLRIRWKLTFSFGMVLFFTVLIIIYAVITANMIDGKYSYLIKGPQHELLLLEDLREDITNMQRLALTILMESGNTEAIKEYEGQFSLVYTSAQKSIEDYIKSNSTDDRRDPEILKGYDEMADRLSGLLSSYKSQVYEPLVEASRTGDLETGRAIYSDDAHIISLATTTVEELAEESSNFLMSSSEELTDNKVLSLGIFTLISSFLILISISIAIMMGRSLLNPVRKLLNMANDLAKGKLDIIRVQCSNDEIGHLMQVMYKLTDTIQSLIKEMDIMGNDFDNGNIDARVNASRFEGSYRSVAERINGMTTKLIDEVITFMDCLKKFGSGNFDADIEELPGKKAIMNENLSTLRGNLKSVAKDIRQLINEASNGNLSNRVDVDKYDGDWAELLKGLNRLMETIIAPINEASSVLREVSLGNFEHVVEGDYKGDFMIIKDSINETVTNVASYIHEISAILGDMSDNDNLNQEITRDYVGDFSAIKSAINNIISKFNDIVYNILLLSDQVAEEARQVSESSMIVARGTSEQASSVEALNSTITLLNEDINSNAENAKNAEDLSGASKRNASSGNQNMNDMLNSMESINNASNNIAQIIKTIDDIAFQTNILALNASVEAARAGDRGKGFAVVAEEVRNLASRSKSAAGETAKLIQESLQRVADGTKSADTTAMALRVIVDDAEKVSDIITDITRISSGQAESINRVMASVSQITEVVQVNTATSEDTASASQELSSQADALKKLVSIFKLKETVGF